MAIRVRKDGTMWCAALTPEQEGDTYIDDGLHYEMSVVKGVIVALPMPWHTYHPQWWWREQAPVDADFSMVSEPIDKPQHVLGRRGGIARAEKLTPERRKEIARKAARARWGK